MAALAAQRDRPRRSLPPLSFLWLEITGRCNLRCTHCYAESQPSGSHGTLTREEWERIIIQARDLGVETVQFIGGEPTLHPHFLDLVRFAAQAGVGIEVYTNLTRVPAHTWRLFEECQVSLATSFYSADSCVHDRVTTRKGSQARTLANIQEAVARGFPLRVGVIDVLDEQSIGETEQMLRSLGVTDVAIDRVRGIGRGAAYDHSERPTDALCGACCSSKAAVDPEGWVYPCVFARWLKIGNVRAQDFADIIVGGTMRMARADLEREFRLRGNTAGAASSELGGPLDCLPPCAPSVCMPDVSGHDLATEPGHRASCGPREDMVGADGMGPTACLPAGPCAPPPPCTPKGPCTPRGGQRG